MLVNVIVRRFGQGHVVFGVFMGRFAGFDGQNRASSAKGHKNERADGEGVAVMPPHRSEDEEDGNDGEDANGKVDDNRVSAIPRGYGCEHRGLSSGRTPFTGLERTQSTMC